MKLESIDCPVCRADDTEHFLKATDINLFGPGEFRLVRCRTCGLVYMNPRPRAEEMSTYYPEHYWAPPPAEDAKPYLDTGMRRTLATLTRQFPGGRVLDVGCGVGRMAALMRRRGLDAMGLEPYEHACNIARQHYGLEVACALLQDADLPEGSFDAVTFFDVLEHVHDPIADLRRARSLLKPGGAVFVKVPNIAALQARLFGKWWYWLDIPRHLFHYSPRSLRRCLEAAGFTEIWCKAIPDNAGAGVFETSMLYWLRGWHLARKRVEVAPAHDETAGQALEGKVYPGVPPLSKRAFRWLTRNVVYAPLAIENLIGRSVEVFAIASK